MHTHIYKIMKDSRTCTFTRRTIGRRALVKGLCVRTVPPGMPTCVRTVNEKAKNSVIGKLLDVRFFVTYKVPMKFNFS